MGEVVGRIHSWNCWACGPVSAADGRRALLHLRSWSHYRGVARRLGWWVVLRSFAETAWRRVRGRRYV